jgi:HlyD family secretion protein
VTINFKTTGKWIKKSLNVAILFSILAAAIYWVKFAPVAVQAYQARRGPIVAEVMGTGTLDAKIKAIISSKISGRIEQVLIEQGDKVVAGQLLVKLDDEQLEQQVKIAQASIETARSGVERSKSDLEFATAVLAMAQQNHDRHKTLLPQNATSQAEFEKAVEGLAVAKAGVRRAQAEITESLKKVAEAERTLAFRKSQLEDSQILAPFDGIILSRQRDPGNVVVPGSEILSLISTEILWIRAWIGETERDKIKLGQSARIVFRSDPKHPYPGQVARLAVEVDEETREFIADVHAGELPANWAIGQRAEVYIKTAKKNNALIIPAKFVKWRGSQAGVFTDNESTAAWHPVELGLHGDGLVEIVWGLKEGERIVNPENAKDKLSDHMRISIQ